MIENELATAEAEQMAREVRGQGAAAFRTGAPRTANPYRKPALAWDDWNEGWTNALHEYVAAHLYTEYDY